MKTRGREWTPEAREAQRQATLLIKPWEKSAPQNKSRWGQMTSAWNCYKCVEFVGNPDGIYDPVVAAARGLLQGLEMQLQRRAPIKQDLEDFRLAIRVIFRFATKDRDITPYGEILQKISNNISEDASPQTVNNSECKDIDIAMRAMRAILKQYCRTS